MSSFHEIGHDEYLCIVKDLLKSSFGFCGAFQKSYRIVLRRWHNVICLLIKSRSAMYDKSPQHLTLHKITCSIKDGHIASRVDQQLSIIHSRDELVRVIHEAQSLDLARHGAAYRVDFLIAFFVYNVPFDKTGSLDTTGEKRTRSRFVDSLPPLKGSKVIH